VGLSAFEKLERHFKVLGVLRTFFTQQGFIDVMTPPVVPNPGMETHIHPFQVSPACSHLLKWQQPQYLHTSPEFAMKELLVLGFQKIFTLTHSFRAEPNSETHRFQFTMLEWYRANSNYEEILQDCLQLIPSVANALNVQLPKPTVKTVAELFQEYAALDILEFLEVEQLRKIIKERFPQLIPGNDPYWEKAGYEDFFFLLFLNVIEPHFKNIPFLAVKEFPAPLAALSTLKKSDSRVAERFEIYLNGVEICNAYNELVNAKEQRRRFELAQQQKLSLYQYQLPNPERFLKNLESGMPPSGGIALGVERLIMALTQSHDVFWD